MVEKIIIYTSAKEEAREKILGVSFIIYHWATEHSRVLTASFLPERLKRRQEKVEN